MRTAIVCLGVLAAGSLLGGTATAQFVPGPSFLGDFGDSGFVPTNAFPYPANGYGFQSNAGIGLPGAMMGNPDLTAPQRQTLSNVRRQFPRSSYGLPRSYDPLQAAPTPPMQQTPYPQPFPYAQQLQNMQMPRYGPLPQYVAQPQMAPYFHFGQQPQYMLTFPMLQPSR